PPPPSTLFPYTTLFRSPTESLPSEPVAAAKPAAPEPRNNKVPGKTVAKAPTREIEDGRRAMHKVFVESKIITADDFDLCWSTPEDRKSTRLNSSHRTIS